MKPATMKTEPTPIRERIVNWLALLALLLAGVVWPPLSDASGSFAGSKAGAGTLYLCVMPCGESMQALRQSTEIRAQVTGNIARVRVRQKFENPSDDWVEGQYVFPLVSGAAVDELEMLVGERRIRGEIQRKQEAHATYERARNEGRRASLVDQVRPNMFTTSVANIAPRSSITIDIAYLETISYRDGRYTLNLPLSITPRYTPAPSTDAAYAGAAYESGETAPQARIQATGVSGGADTRGATAESVTSAVQSAQIDVDLEPGFPLQSVQSLHHEIGVQVRGAGRRIRLRSSTIPTDRDFELVWRPSVEPETHASAFAEQVGDETYVLVTLMPPTMTAERSYRREVLFIIDTSGSMAGASIEQARAALRLGVKRLQPTDAFNIIRFSDDASSLFPTSQPAVAINRQTASDFIDDLSADGGTEMRAALDLAFSMPAASGALRQIVFVTDGSVSNEAELVQRIHQKIDASRLFTVGIGAAPNAWFMREAASAGRGSYTFIPQIDQVGERMADLFRKLENPALVDLQLDWPGGAVATLAAALPRDIYAGDPLTIAARLPRAPKGLLTLSGRSASGAWSRQLPLTLVTGQAGIAKLWARERIAELSRQKNLGSRSGPDAAPDLEAQIVNLALEHHLVSDYTSLVAVDVTPVRPEGVDVLGQQVPTSAPRGSAWATSTGFAATATPAPLLLLSGLLALLCAVGLQWHSARKSGA